MVCGVWIRSCFCWKSQLPGKGAVVRTAKRLTRINSLASFEVKKLFFSRSESRTVYRFLLVFLFCVGPATVLGDLGIFIQPLPSCCWCLLSWWNPFWFRPGSWYQFAILRGECRAAGKRGRCTGCWGTVRLKGAALQPAAGLCSCGQPGAWKSQLTARLF